MSPEDIADYMYNDEPWYTRGEMDQVRSLIKNFFVILERTETNDEGVEFRPTKISSCRTFDAQRLSKVLKEMKEFAEGDDL